LGVQLFVVDSFKTTRRCDLGELYRLVSSDVDVNVWDGVAKHCFTWQLRLVVAGYEASSLCRCGPWMSDVYGKTPLR
jgi:hypothetical protein